MQLISFSSDSQIANNSISHSQNHIKMQVTTNLKTWDQYVGLLALMMLLIPQVQHTIYVYENNSQHGPVWFSWCYAAGIDLAILIFTLRGWKRMAIGYLFATLATNIIYQFYPIGWLAKIVLSVLLSITIYFFSELYKREKQQKEVIKKQESEEDQNKQVFAKAIKMGIDVQINPYVCPECGEGFPTSKKLNGHISGHKAKKEWTPEKYGEWEKLNEERAKFIREHQESINKTIGIAA